jgi:hypothetical protein
MQDLLGQQCCESVNNEQLTIMEEKPVGFSKNEIKIIYINIIFNRSSFNISYE